jgi:ankyrin repeat protein
MASFACVSCASTTVKVGPITKGILISMIRNYESDAVMVSLIEKNPELLLDADENDKTVLMWAIEKGREAVVNKCFENGTYIENVDNDGWTAIMFAARRGHLGICEHLLNLGANVDVESVDDKFSPLHLAAGNECMPVCEQLIKAGAQISRRDIHGKVPFDYIRTPKNQELYRKAVEDIQKAGLPAAVANRRRLESEIKSEKSVSFLALKTAMSIN